MTTPDRAAGSPAVTPRVRVAPLRLSVASPPDPGQLRPAIAAVLAGRPWPPGVEGTVAQAVADAVAGAREVPS